MNLKNKIGIVTGGSRGIGKAISLNLAKAGVSVIFTYKEQKIEAKKTQNLILGEGGQATSIQMDVTDRKSVHKVMEAIKTQFGHIDILVNNAGINKPTDFDKITDLDWDTILNVNLKGPLICTQEALPLLKKSKNASIINIGSVSGQYGGPRTAHYAASKAGLISLGQVIARFVSKDNIRCNTLAAGLIASEMANEGLKSNVVSNAVKSILLNRLGTMQEIADVVLFLASDKSSYITGQTINVNGGLYF